MINDKMTVGEGLQANTAMVPAIVNGWNASSAKLYLFTPKHIMDYVNRPLTYNLGTEFTEALCDLATQRLRSPLNGNPTEFYLPYNPVAAASILPNTQGTLVRTSAFSNDWTFVLIVDTPSIGGTSNNRRLYSGIAVGCDPSLNGLVDPGTLLNFTKLSSVEYDTCQNREFVYGQGDWDLINVGVRQQLSSDNQAMDLHPSALCNSITSVDPENGQLSMFSVADNKFADTNDGTIKINETELNGSAQHLSSLTSAIVNGVNIASYDDESVPIVGATETVTKHVGSTLGMTRKLVNPRLTEDGVVINPTKPYTVGELDGLFRGQLCVTIVKQPNDNGIDKDTCTNTVSRRNIFTNLLASSITEVLIRYGLGSVSFTYMSATTPDNYGIVGADTSAVMLHHISDIAGCSNETVVMAWNKFYSYLHDRVFSIIKQAANDDFRVEVNASLFASTFICLNFLSEPEDRTFTEINNTLGGLNSAEFGNSDVFANNVQQLNGVIQTVCNETGLSMSGPDDFSTMPY